MSSPRYDYAIIGGGIAGLAIAEVFARAGHSVVLLERNAHVCEEASASHHGWFHFGSLYSIFPQNQYLRTLIGGVEDLREFYAQFPRMNITTTDTGKLAFPPSAGAWFRDEPIEYIVSARNDPDFDMRHWTGPREYARKVFFLLTWEMAIKQFISRHQRFHKHDWRSGAAASQWIARAGFADYSREVITKPNHPGINLDIDTHFRITGYDRPMRSVAIVTDLVRSLLGAGGEIRTNAEADRIERSGGRAIIHTAGGETIEAGQVIVSAGKWLGRFLSRASDVRVVASPLLVAWPAVADRHFVRMTPFVERSVNHLHHEIGTYRYSVIGGGYFADPNDDAATERASAKLREMAQSVFPRLADAKTVQTYLGYKTEIVPQSGERNYQYVIRKVDDNVHAVVPGKFSLGFSLAVNTYRRITGKFPPVAINLAPAEAASGFVGPARHAAMVLAAMPEQPEPLLPTLQAVTK